MPLQSPVNRDLSSWNSKVSNSVWEISTPEKNSLYWSIILPYLIPSTRSKDPADFARRLKNLTDDNEGIQSVRDQLKSFNPFKKKHAFHFGNNMTDVLHKFKKKINRSTNIRPVGTAVEVLKLDAASKMLNCFIEVYNINSTGIENYRLYSPKSKSVNSSLNLDTIIIFHHPNTQVKNREKDTFGFGFRPEISRSLQEKGLTFILRKDKFLKENNARIQEASRSSDNFLISLLNSDVKNVIPIIYKSPYILSKLQNAGYNTNPLVKGGDGLSAFNLCINLTDSQYLYILYNYVSNNFYESGESCRKPSDQTSINLNNLKSAFETDREISVRISSLTDIAANRYREISKFNEYQINVVKILKDQQKSADDIVLAILTEYINNFLFNPLPNDENSQFENYLKFSDYCENLDSYTSILLFDHLLTIKNKAYSDLVEPLFLMIMSDNYFSRKEHNHDRGSLVHCKGCAHRVIPFKYRMNFFKVLMEVLDKVHKGSAENMRSPDDIIRKSVESIPKDEFLLSRLKTSLEIAINVEADDTKGVLTIFRTLQILGEVFATSMTENFASGFLLYAHLPLTIILALRNIRNDISHYKAHSIQDRLNLETRTDLFKKIQDDLKVIYEALEPVFSCQRFKMKEFIIQSASPLFEISKEELKNIATDREIWCQTQREQFKLFAVNVFRFFEKNLEESFLKDPKANSQKIKRLQDGAEALNFIFSFKITLDDPLVAKDLTDAQKELQEIIRTLKQSQPADKDIEDLRNTFQKYVSLLKQVFNVEVNDDTHSRVNCDNLIYLKQNLRNHNVFAEEENLKIRKIISDFLRPSFEATMKLETSLREQLKSESQSFDPENIDKDLMDTLLSDKNRKIIKRLFSPNKKSSSEDISKGLKILEDLSYDSEDKALGTEQETTKKILEMFPKDEYKKALLNLSSSFEQSLENKFLKLMNQKMEFLIKKINLIENILIDEEDNIRDLVKWGRSKEIKKHNKFLMRQRYVMELDVKLSLEMLLFDCMNIMDNRKDLATIYTKMNDMFVGADLRNVLSHGNILIDSLGTLLDPDDLPSELIIKMLELIDDRKSLNALSSLWMEKKQLTTKELEESLVGWKNVDDIKNCTRWKSYSVLLPVK